MFQLQGTNRVERQRARVVLHPLRALEWRAAMKAIEVVIALGVMAALTFGMTAACGQVVTLW